MIKQEISHFEQELKKRLKMKESHVLTSEIVLLNAFKYFDYKDNGYIDFQNFKKVLKVKLNINIFLDNQLNPIYKYYLNSFENKGFLDYRQFISFLYNKNFILKPKKSITYKDQPIKKQKSNVKILNVIESDRSIKIDKILENIYYKLRKKNIDIFLQLYQVLKNYDTEDIGFILVEDFLEGIKKLDVHFDIKEINDLKENFVEKKNLFDYEKLFRCFFLNFNSGRAACITYILQRVDYNNTGKININILKELFDSKKYFEVRSGRKTDEEIKKGFYNSINIFMNLFNKIVDSYEFTILFKFLSSYIEDDYKFKKFIQESFKYTQIKKMLTLMVEYENINQGDDYNPDSVLIDEPSKVIKILTGQISKKGEKGYINLLNSFKNKDYDRDKYLYINEFKKSLDQQRIVLRENQFNSLFNYFCQENKKLNYFQVMDVLVPKFAPEKISILKYLYEDLLTNSYGNNLQVFIFQNSFNAKGHPYFIDGSKNEFQITREFNECLNNFVICYNNHQFLNYEIFLRFFEFLGRDWSENFFVEIMENCFSKRKRVINYKKNEKKSNKKISNKNLNSKITSIRSIVNSRKSGLTQRNQEKNNEYDKKKKETLKRLKIEKNETDSYTRRLEEEMKMKKIENMSNLSPANSYSSRVYNEESAYKLNKKIQNSIIKQEDRIFNNINRSNKLESSKNPFNVFKKQILDTFQLNLLLQMEYEMTLKSDMKGFINFPNFYKVLYNLKLIGKLTENEIFTIFETYSEKDQLHVQIFTNELRGQMDESKELIVLDLFERLSGYKEIIEIDYFKKSFISENLDLIFKNKFKNSQKLFDFMIELFYFLNLDIKNREYFDLDDFLYFFDNFSFFCSDYNQFKLIIRKCFK